TGHRWDTSAHRVHEPARINANGTPYEPYHEVQAMVEGPAAAALGALVRDRWQTLGERTRPLSSSRASRIADDVWPAAIEPDLIAVEVGIGRTMPPSERAAVIRECERLFVDAIAAAERSIYIESQYFTNDTLARALAERLQEDDGPEAIVVVPRECHGWVEQQTMGALRYRALCDLIAAGRHRRRGLAYPAAPRNT